MSSKKKRINESNEDRVFNIFVYILLTIIFIAVAYPLIYVLSASISSAEALVTGKVWLYPVDLSLEGFKTVFEYKQVWTGYANTIFYTVIGTSINVILTIMIAYPLSKRVLPGKKLFMLFITFTMFFNGGLIPTYLLVHNLGLVNTRLAMLLPNAIMVWNVILTRTFFQSTLPDELYESTSIDGCTNIKFIYYMVIPLSKPIIAVITLYYAVRHWNSYFEALIYLRNNQLFPLQIILRNILVENQLMATSTDLELEEMLAREYMAELLKYALIIVSSLPLLIIYPFVQKHFVKGVMVGALKG